MQSLKNREEIDARSVILLIKNSLYYTKVDHHKWILKHLFQPISLKEDEHLQVLHCSNTRLASLIQAQTQRRARKLYTFEDLPHEHDIREKHYRLMPHTRIITLSKKYRMVFLVDVTSSLATIDYATENIIMSEVFETLRKCLEGLAQPFVLQDLEKDQALLVEPEISIIVIAECSQFASNANLIPLLAGFPTMQVLLQGIVITEKLLPQIIAKLQMELAKFQDSLASFRQSLRRKDFAVAYVMDVAGPKTEELADVTGSGKPLFDKKDNIWKLGSSGGNLSYSLNAGLFAMDLLPNEGLPSLVIITDGVLKSNLANMSIDDDVLQLLSNKGINCNIIQVGSSQGFNPGCNFGLVPDNEILRFVAAATFGLFLYSSDCPKVAINSEGSKMDYGFPPNFYHKCLLMKEFSFNKKKGESRYLSIPGVEDRAIDVPRERYVNGEDHMLEFNSYKFFPWDPKSEPPAVEAILTRFQEYSLLIDVQLLVAARIRQGFTIDHVVLVENRNNSKTEKICITMSRLWLPNVTIQYKIKALWAGEVKGMTRLKSPRIEINVLAYTVFALYFVNFQTAQQNNDPSHPLFSKIIRMVKFLTTIHETDESFKKYLYFKSSKDNSKSYIRATENISSQSSSSRLENFIQFRDSLENRLATRSWCDEIKFDYLFAPTVSYPMPQSLATERLWRKALSKIRENLKNSWASFSPSSNVYVKVIDRGEKNITTSFCELRLDQQIGCLWNVKLAFFNIDVSHRRHSLQEIINILSDEQSYEDKNYMIHICKRPLSRLLLKALNISSEGEFPVDTRLETGYHSIAQSYLRHYRRAWLTDLDDEVFFKDLRITPIQDLAFQYLCRTRIDEGYILVYEKTDKQIFYRELQYNENNPNLKFGDNGQISKVCGIQYQVFKDSSTGEITTELWMEPTQDIDLKDIYNSISRQIQETDRLKLSHLVTFDQICYIAIANSKQQQNLHLHSGNTHEKNSQLDKPQFPELFDLAALLHTSKFLVANYIIPLFKASPITGSVNSGKVSPANSDTTIRSSFFDPRSPKILQNPMSTSNHGSPLDSNKNQSSQIEQQLNLDVYNSYRNSIAKLNGGADRDFALFHLFLEKAFSKYASGEINTEHESCKKDQLLNRIYLALSEFIDTNKITLQWTRDLQETKCFVKMIDSSSFILIIIPSLKVILDRLHGFFENNQDPFYLNILLFLCKRPRPLHGDDNPVNYLHYTFENMKMIKPISMGTSFRNSTSNIANYSLDPHLFAGGHKNPLSSDEAAKITRGITKLFAYSFTQSIYSSIIQKRCVDPNDLRKAINTCIEVDTVDIDITGYVNVHVQAARKSPDGDEEIEVYQKFISVLGQYFEPATFIDPELQNIYFYRASIKKANAQSLEKDMAPDLLGNFAEIFTCAENPLFIRLECTFKKAAVPALDTEFQLHKDFQSEEASVLGDANFVKFTVSTLPTSYSCIVDGKFHDFTPRSVGTEESPVASTDGTTATLHIICLTLPTFKEEAVKLSSGFKDLQIDSHASRFEHDKSRSTFKSVFSQDKIEALEETQSRIEWLLKEEILHGLLKSHPFDSILLKYVQMQLESNKQFLDYPTAINMPLSFVRRMKGQEKFLQEFQKADMSPYSLNQVEDCFYLSENAEVDELSSEHITKEPSNILDISMDNNPKSEDVLEQSVSKGSDLNISYNDSGGEYTYNGGDDLCGGLGISFDSPETINSNAGQKTFDSLDKRNSLVNQKFWLLLVPREFNIVIFYYSKIVTAAKRNEIIKYVQNCIEKVLKRVNQLVLLDELNETHRCSKYLVAPPESTPESKSSSASSASEEESDAQRTEMEASSGSLANLSTLDHFKPGQFECPLVFKETFLLHRRLKPNYALNTITSLVLDSFAIINRKHMFVIPKGDYIVYLRLSEIGVPTVSEFENTIEESNIRYGYSPYIHSSFIGGNNNSQEIHSTTPIIGSDDNRRSPSNKSASPRTSNTVSPSSRKVGSAAQSRIFGETRELVMEVYGVDMPGREITEELVSLLDNKLTTNITLGVISSFLARTLNAKPTSADVDFILPILKTPTCKKMLNIPGSVKNLYAFLFFFKQNLSNYLTVLSGPDVINTLNRHYIARYGINWNTESGRKTMSSVHLGEFAFYYNCVQARASSFETKGISGICLTLMNQNGRPIFEIPPSDSIINDDESNKNDDNTAMVKFVKVLLDDLDHIFPDPFKQTLCDYFVELYIIKGLSQASDDSSLEQQSLNLDSNQSASTNRDNSATHLERHIQKIFIEPSLMILEQSADLGNPAVKSLEMAADMPFWIMDDFLREIHELLSEVHCNFFPIILRRTSLSDSFATDVQNLYEIYHPSKTSEKRDVTSGSYSNQYFLISGLKELCIRYGPSVKLSENRRGSLGSDLSISRKSSIEDFSQNTDTNEKIGSTHHRKSSLFTSVGQQKSFSEESIMSYTSGTHSIASSSEYNNAQVPSNISRSCFLIMSIDGFTMSVYTYNLQKNYSEQIFTSLKKISNWHNDRMQLLNNILHQKMGLFYHIDSISNNKIPSTFMQFPSAPHTPRVVPSPMPGSSALFNNTTQKPPHVENLLKMQQQQQQQQPPSLSIPSQMAAQTPPRTGVIAQDIADLGYVKSLIRERFPQRPANDNRPSSEEETKKTTSNQIDIRHDSPSTAANNSELEKITNNTPSVSTLELNEVLKDAFVETAVEYGIDGNERDALLRHGPPFMATCIRQAKISQAHENALKVYEKWVKRYQGGEDIIGIHTIARSDLAIIFRTSRILHFCRTPLLFGGTPSNRIQIESMISQQEQQRSKNETILNWYQTMIVTFLQNYASYLETIGMQIVIFGKSDSNLVDDGNKGFPSFTSKFSISENVAIDCPAVFLLKALQGGSIMCEVRIQGVFVCVTLYTLNRRYGRLRVAAPGFDVIEGDRNSLKIFTEECGRFKKLIHVNSFVYDFHLNYIKYILENQKNIPAPFSILEFIKAFINVYSRSASYAENRIYYDKFEKVSSSIQKDLYSYIAKNPQRYGFFGIPFENEPIACYTNDFDQAHEHIEQREGITSYGKQRIFIFTHADQLSLSGKLVLDYFIIVLNQNNDSSKVTSTQDLSQCIDHDEERFNHIKYAREILDSIVTKAIEFSGRDTLWNQLRPIKSVSMTGQMNHEDFLELTQRWRARELITINPDFKQILELSLNWFDVLNFLCNYYGDDARELHEHSRRHLLIFNPHNHDHLIQFVFNEENRELIVVNTVCREALPNSEGLELEFAGDISRTICYMKFCSSMSFYKPKNCVQALLEREIHSFKPNTNLANNRQFYTTLFPNETIFVVKVPNFINLRRFTPDGKMILASSIHSLCSPEEARKYPCSLDSLSKFEDVTFYLIEIETGQICDKITFENECIYLSHHYGVALIGNLFSVLSVQNQTIHILHIREDGHFVDERSIGWFNHEDDELVMARYREFNDHFEARKQKEGNSYKKRKLSHESSIYEEIMHPPSTSSSYESISLIDRMDFEVPSTRLMSPTLHIPTQTDPEIMQKFTIIEDGSPPYSGIKQKLLAYLFKQAHNTNDGGSALRHFYQIFEQLSSLVMWRLQFIDESRLLIKFTNLDCIISYHAENAINPAFFVIYNYQESEIESVYDNASEEFLDAFEKSSETFQQIAFNEPFLFNSTYSNNLYARENLRKHQYAVRYARNGGPTQAIKRVLACLPFSPQSRSESPYFDQSLFIYDEKIISACDRPKPCQDGPIKFHSRVTGELKFQIHLTQSNRSGNRSK
ncbi:2965_t:CDS:10 [Ambispora gerdemannii]|uniref:2965_t:CDS:1 n=1 Tax=Ambispora gerdemannii TaxID=144530 RepID=A0A9N8ZQH1_9GLOM|nr:2965_t:CDS:10 [Ambispora gerdemannii]